MSARPINRTLRGQRYGRTTEGEGHRRPAQRMADWARHQGVYDGRFCDPIGMGAKVFILLSD